jgi:hypothetical protein
MGQGPTQAGFNSFVQQQMGIATAVLPVDSIYLVWAYQQSLALVNQMIATASSVMYLVAVYNLAGAILLDIAQDVANAPPVTGSKPPQPFFAYTRTRLNLNSFVTGVISSTSDEGTSESLVVPDQLKNLTIADLQLAKTPWGQRYLGIAQSVGSDWGMS